MITIAKIQKLMTSGFGGEGMPDLQTVDHENRAGDVFGAKIQVENVEVRWPDRKGLQGNSYTQNSTGSLEFFYRAWEINFTPREGDRITHNSQVYLVQSIRYEMLNQRIRISTNRGA